MPPSSAGERCDVGGSVMWVKHTQVASLIDSVSGIAQIQEEAEPGTFGKVAGGPLMLVITIKIGTDAEELNVWTQKPQNSMQRLRRPGA